MSELITFRSLRKLRFFLVGVFPFLARTPRWIDCRCEVSEYIVQAL